MTSDDGRLAEAQRRERWRLLRSLDQMMEGPLVVLAFVWLGLLVVEFVSGADARLDALVYLIWAVFILEVVIKLIIAPDRLGWLRRNWLKLVSLAIPALRVLRVFSVLRFLRAAQIVRSASLLRLLTSLNRGFAVLGRTLRSARFAYVLAISVLIVVVGAAGILFFEGAAMDGYGEALWWTAMMLTTIGSEYWPVSAEGRVLAFLLAAYAVGVFGYVTATIATHFLGLGQRAQPGSADRALRDELVALRSELAGMRAELAQLSPGDQRR